MKDGKIAQIEIFADPARLSITRISGSSGLTLRHTFPREADRYL
jgi:hypothetical protein